MSSVKISDLRQIFAEDLRDDDLLLLSIRRLERDEDRMEQESVSISLKELKRYLNGSCAPPIANATEPIGTTHERMKGDFTSRFRKLAGMGGKSRDGHAECGSVEYTSLLGTSSPVKVRSGFIEEKKAAMEKALENEILRP